MGGWVLLLENRFPLFLRDFQEFIQVDIAFQIELEGLVELPHQLFRGWQPGELIRQVAFLEDGESRLEEWIGGDEVRRRVDIAREGICYGCQLGVAVNADQEFDQLPGFGCVFGVGADADAPRSIGQTARPIVALGSRQRGDVEVQVWVALAD